MMDYNNHRVMKYRSFRAKKNIEGTPSKSASQLVILQNRRTRCQHPEKNVCRLQNCMPLKFKEMVKTHLASTLDMQPDQLENLLESPPTPLPRRKTSITFSKKKAQKHTMLNSSLAPESIAPVLQLINYLSQDDVIATEGLFRKTGNICRQKQLKLKLETATLTYEDMTALSPHDCANVLKSYINNLPEPLLTQKLIGAYDKIANIARLTKEETTSAQFNAMQLVLQLLPADNINLLKPLVILLNRVATNPNNLMTAYSLGIIFAPHLLCDRYSSADSLHTVLPKVADLVTLMIQNGLQIFNTPRELSVSATNFWREMEVPNQLYYNTVKINTDSITATPSYSRRCSPKVHVVDLQVTPPPMALRKRLSSDTSDGIPEKRPSPEMFLSTDCDVTSIKPTLRKQTNSIIFHTKPLSSTEKPVARVKPMQQSPISQFFKSVPLKLQKVMSTPRSRAPMALFQSPSLNTNF